MKKLPEIQKKTKSIKLGSVELDFRQITLSEYNIFVDLQEAERNKDEKAVFSNAVLLLATLLDYENTLEEKVSFIQGIEIAEIKSILDVVKEIVLFSGLEIVEDKKKQAISE